MVFCNVVICNCGHFGGSLAVSPYRQPERRTIYQHAGAGLATGQIIELPVAPLDLHQSHSDPMSDGEKAFKSLPPGYRLPVVPISKAEKSDGRALCSIFLTGSPAGRVLKIGRASCRERVCQYVSLSVVAVSLKK